MISHDDEDRLRRLWDTVREFERRVVSNTAVTTSNGVKVLEVAPVAASPDKSQLTIRDANGHALLRNDVNAGWGLAAPQNGYATYANSLFVTTSGTSFVESWLFGGYMYSPSVEYGYIAGGSTGTTVECRLEYSTGHIAGPWTVVPGSTQQSTDDISGNTFTVRSGTFTVPLSSAGQIYGIRLMSRVVSGPGPLVGSGPVYLNNYN